MREEKYKLIKIFPNIGANIGTIKYNWQWESMHGFDVSRWPEFFEKVKEPLMMTFDGKEMFEPTDIIFFMQNGMLYPISVFSAIRNLSIKYFSTPSLAKEYFNKLRFSEKHILEAIDNSRVLIDSKYINLEKFKKELGI
jgi:hypothetical protein